VTASPPSLTPRQAACLGALVRHRGNRKAAAAELGITAWTFTYHLRAACAAAGVDSVVELAVIHAGLLEGEVPR
jgi:DNA-binding CsgD family transcriptional regulator